MTVKQSEKVWRTNRQTNTHTDIRTFRVIERIGPEGLFFENLNVTKLKNSDCDKTQNSKLKDSGCDKTQQLKLWQKSKTQIVGKLKKIGSYQTEN